MRVRATGVAQSLTGPQGHPKKSPWKDVLLLSYQSLGVVYGDLSTSPSTLHEDDEEVLGVLSFIFWTLTLIPLFKYIFIVLSADDNGEGGTFALYSLLCRHARLGLQPNQQHIDEKLSSYKAEGGAETRQSSRIKGFFSKHPRYRHGLLIVVLFGTCMAIGDGVLTPTISDYVVAISCIILVGLFSLQHHGTHRVAFIFAPIVAAWLLCISSIGVYNIARWNPGIFRAISPSYLVRFLRATGVEGWVSLGGVVLCITGAETMFADLGHFSPTSIKIAFSFLVYPCLVLAYMGEAAFLSRHHEDIQRSFYRAIPEAVFWPVFLVATSAAVVGSQAAISATFSIVSQCCALNCFPRVKIIHTSKKIYGQVYIPEVNWVLMCLCLAVTIGLRDTNKIGHAYGLAVSTVMFVTTCLMSLVMIIVWKQRMVWAALFLVFFGSIEMLYVSASTVKVPEGGWIPLSLSAVFMVIMYVWNYGTLKKHEFDLENKPRDGPRSRIGLIYADIVTGLPSIFGHFATNLPAFHQVPHVSDEERFLVGRLGPEEFRMFRCVVRYGYRDLQQENHDFEAQLVSRILAFVEMEGEDCMVVSRGRYLSELGAISDGDSLSNPALPSPADGGGSPAHDRSGDIEVEKPEDRGLAECSFITKDESVEILRARESGVAYILGRSHAKAKKSSPLIKKIAINIIFGFLSKNCRGSEVVLNVPYSSVLEVGMVYYI
ncbi:unnamed protein product [Spirodela intermedia]|uniref:Potassium transporter n=1 Tax=Spirodela intermedia TaxID=51605 RepID=A0A7I8IBL9_SPIIN|nr:unnamed protein product [Spirodela intermedia]CAA6654734.1 unnamed protein product [Spirodela intermedia]